MFELAQSFGEPPFALEVAAGERPTEGYIHHDFRSLPHIEIVCDAREELLSTLGAGSCNRLRACHILEHFPYSETEKVLSIWRDLLVPGGSLHIEVPNLGWQVKAMASGEIEAEEFVYFAYGQQNYEGNFHMAGFTYDLLRDKLLGVGFKNIRVTDIGQVLVAEAARGN